MPWLTYGYCKDVGPVLRRDSDSMGALEEPEPWFTPGSADFTLREAATWKYVFAVGLALGFVLGRDVK